VAGEIEVAGVEIRFVETGEPHGVLQVVRDEHQGSAAEELEHVHVGHKKGSQIGPGKHFGVGVVGSAQAAAEDRRLGDLPGPCRDDGLGLAGQIDEGFLPGSVCLAHDDVDRLLPAAVVVAELGVLQAVFRVIVPVFDPELLQCHAVAAEFPVQVLVVGFEPATGRSGVAGVEAGVELGVGEAACGLVADAGRLGPAERVAHRASRTSQALGDLPLGEALFV